MWPRMTLDGVPALRLAYLALTGLGVGTLSGLLGVGGGIIAIPALVWILHLNQHVAQGTSLAVMVPTALWGVYRYARRGHVAWGPAAAIGTASVVLATVSSHVAFILPSRVLQALFAAFLIYLTIRNATHSLTSADVAATRRNIPRGTPAFLLIGGAVGSLGGLLGIGGGSLAVPALVLFCDFPQQTAQGTSLAAIVLSALAGATNYASAGRVDFPAAIALAAGAFLTVPLGAWIAYRLPDRSLAAAFSLLLAVLSVLSIVRAV